MKLLAARNWLGAAIVSSALVVATSAIAAPTTKPSKNPDTAQASPSAKKIYDEAVTAQKKGEAAKAANLFARYIADPSSSPRLRDKAVKELSRLSPKLGRLSIDAAFATSVSVDGQPLNMPLPDVVYVTPGVHSVEARFTEDTVSESPNAAAGEDVRVTLAEPQKPVPVTDGTTQAPQQKPERHKPFRPLVVYVGAGATVAAAVLTVLSGIDTQNQKSSFDQERTQENLDAGKSRQLRTNILLGVTGGLAVFTGVSAIWFVDWKRNDASLKVGVGPTSLRLSGVF